MPNLSLISPRRHVATDHERKPVSLRCKDKFSDVDQLAEHLNATPQCVPSMDLLDPDPEHGITPEIKKALRSRRAKSKVNTWERLWKVLFPDDQDIPEPGKSESSSLYGQALTYPR